jgi:hypothetical protein
VIDVGENGEVDEAQSAVATVERDQVGDIADSQGFRTPALAESDTAHSAPGRSRTCAHGLGIGSSRSTQLDPDAVLPAKASIQSAPSYSFLRSTDDASENYQSTLATVKNGHTHRI